MSVETVQEARRQIEICNACRYCEGYCAVFPAITRQTAFADGDITQLIKTGERVDVDPAAGIVRVTR